jgi:HEAT repeat protein
MRVFDKRKPNVKALARKGDVDGLIDAAGHTELVPGPDGDPVVDVGVPIREEALLALRDVAPDRAAHVFVTALDDSSERVRIAAVVALYERGDSDRLAEAVAKLPAERGEAHATAVQALFRLHNAGSSRSLAEALVHRRDDYTLGEEEQELVPALLRAEARPEAAGEVVDVLISALGDEQEIVAERAEALLVRLGPASIEALVHELAGGAVPHRAATLIGEIKDGRGLQPLVVALSHPDARVRRQSCSALGKLRDPAAVEPLLHATRDPEHQVRVQAGAALDSMGTAAIALSITALLRPMLGEIVKDESPGEMPSNGGAHHSLLPVASNGGLLRRWVGPGGI